MLFFYILVIQIDGENMIIMELQKTLRILERVMRTFTGHTEGLTMTSTTHSQNFSVHLEDSNLALKAVVGVTAMENGFFTNKASHLRHIIAPS